ncbi:MAG: OmpP1/FadL family transporter [Hyphomicrobiaceae bacterium]
MRWAAILGRERRLAAVVAATALAASLAEPVAAGGFSVREQSAEYQGSSFAGNGAAGGGLSGMFWNPAVAAYAPAGFYSESHYSAVFGRVEITGDSFINGVNLGLPRDSGDIAKDAVVPASYMSWRINPQLVAAISVNSPFGLTTEPSNRFWAGQTFARTSEIKTYNFSPTLAYKLTPGLAVAVGLQIEHIEGRLKAAAGNTPGGTAEFNNVVRGDDTAFGVTAGINWMPSAHTSIGLGYRSSIDHTLEGTVTVPGAVAGVFGAAAPLLDRGAAIKGGITLPEIVTASLRHGLTDRFAVLGTVEWSHWSRLEKFDVICANNATGNPAFCPLGNGQLVSSLPLGWHDGWFFALGGEYRYTERLMLRAGGAYEISPVQSADERSQRVPDVDRVWASLGATYKWNDQISFDIGYSHIFGLDGDIDRTTRLGAFTERFIGSVDSQVDIVSASLKVKLGGAEPAPESLK